MMLASIWFVLVMVLLIGYAVLDGFDLGVGILHLFARNNEERRAGMLAIGPVWDGNEVWLIAGGGALFAAFPAVYATAFEGFYLALVLVLLALVARAVSLEFRGKVASTVWRRAWDWAFGFGSLLVALLLGVALGNILRGLPIDADGAFTGTFLGLLHPYALAWGLLSVAACTMHGAAYLVLKADGALQVRMKRWVNGAWVVFVCLLCVVGVSSAFASPFLLAGLAGKPLSCILMLLFFAGLVSTSVTTKMGSHLVAFVSSALTIASVIGVLAVGLYPRLIPSSIDLSYSLTVDNASSSYLTLRAMLIIALIGVPIVIGYTAFVYSVFKGKVDPSDTAY